MSGFVACESVAGVKCVTLPALGGEGVQTR